MRTAWLRLSSLFLVVGLLVAQSPPVPAGGTQGAKTDGAARQAVPLADTGLSMVLPLGCEVGDEKAAGARFFALRPAGDQRGLSVNVTDHGGKVPEAIDVEGLRKALVAELSKALASYKLVGDGKRTVLGKEAYWISGTFASGGTTLRNLQVMLPTTPAFWITFTGVAGEYDAVVAEIEASLATLTASAKLRGAQRVRVRTVAARLHVDDQGFSFEPPAAWLVGDESMAAGAFLFAAGPVDEGFAANVNVRTMPGMARLDIPSMSKQIREELGRALSDCTIDEVTGVKLGKLQGLRTRATYRMPVGELAMVQYIVPAQPSSFVLTYTTTRTAMAKAFAGIEKSAGSVMVAAAARK